MAATATSTRAPADKAHKLLCEIHDMLVLALDACDSRGCQSLTDVDLRSYVNVALIRTLRLEQVLA